MVAYGSGNCRFCREERTMSVAPVVARTSTAGTVVLAQILRSENRTGDSSG